MARDIIVLRLKRNTWDSIFFLLFREEGSKGALKLSMLWRYRTREWSPWSSSRRSGRRSILLFVMPFESARPSGGMSLWSIFRTKFSLIIEDKLVKCTLTCRGQPFMLLYLSVPCNHIHALALKCIGFSQVYDWKMFAFLISCGLWIQKIICYVKLVLLPN